MVRFYGLFKKVNGKWVRMYPELSYPKATAVRVFQGELLACALGAATEERSLRPLTKRGQ